MSFPARMVPRKSGELFSVTVQALKTLETENYGNEIASARDDLTAQKLATTVSLLILSTTMSNAISLEDI
jgi:hypothetical protein